MLENRYRPAHILCGGELYWEYSDEKFASFLDELSPRRARFDLQCTKFGEDAEQAGLVIGENSCHTQPV